MKHRSISTLFTLLFTAASVVATGPLLAQDQTRDRLQLQDQIDVPDQDRIQDRLHDTEDALQDRDQDRLRDRIDQVEEPDQDRVQDRIHQ